MERSQSTGRTRRICSPTAVSKRSYFSSKQNKFKLLACLTLILQWKQTAGASLPPLIDLDLTTNNQIEFQIPGNHSLMLFRNPQAMVLYSTSLDYNRQLVQIDRIVDANITVQAIRLPLLMLQGIFMQSTKGTQTFLYGLTRKPQLKPLIQTAITPFCLAKNHFIRITI